MKRTREPWSQDDDAILLEARRTGATWSEIAATLHRNQPECIARHSALRATGRVALLEPVCQHHARRRGGNPAVIARWARRVLFE